MILLIHARSKLRAALKEIKNLQRDDFPQPDTLEALKRIEGVFQESEEKLNRVSGSVDPLIISAVCTEITIRIATYLPIAGFLRRSTIVRNAFEFYGPILLLARKLLGTDTRLVISSEWKFSPFAYPPVYPGLEEFALIGLPASESSNALILPLCAHELGHLAWRQRNVSKTFRVELHEVVLDAIKDRWDEFSELHDGVTQEQIEDNFLDQAKWISTLDWALRQCEEIFCDFVALRVFGESYLHAFQYILAPYLGQKRSPYYPSNQERVSHLAQAAGLYGVTIPPDYSASFLNESIGANERGRFLLSVCSQVVADRVQDLAVEAKKICDDCGIPAPDSSASDAAYKDIQLCSPPHVTPNIADLINGGWRASLDDALWSDRSDLQRKRVEILNDLLLKALEVIEVKELLARENNAAQVG